MKKFFLFPVVLILVSCIHTFAQRYIGISNQVPVQNGLSSAMYIGNLPQHPLGDATLTLFFDVSTLYTTWEYYYCGTYRCGGSWWSGYTYCPRYCSYPTTNYGNVSFTTPEGWNIYNTGSVTCAGGFRSVDINIPRSQLQQFINNGSLVIDSYGYSLSGCSNVAYFTLSYDYATTATNWYPKPTGDLQNLSTWGRNLDGTGMNPTSFDVGIFNLVNQGIEYSLNDRNWFVGGMLNIPIGSSLNLNDSYLAVSSVAGLGTISGSAEASLTITGNTGGSAGTLRFTPGAESLARFTLNRPNGQVTLGTPLKVKNLELDNGTLNTSGLLTLLSDDRSDAIVGPIPPSAGINGDVTVERYIPARKAWRVLAAPVGGSQTIYAAWQEGLSTSSPVPNLYPGYGVQITGGSVANGFDQSATISIKRYNTATNTWVNVANTNNTAVNSNAFMLFVAGDRSKNPSTKGEAGSTTLRVKGPLKTGSQTFAVANGGWVAIPNPYASPINFAAITKNNVYNSFYVWDPKLGGANGVGAYVSFSWNGSSYDATPAPVSPMSQYIQSGQGFMVYASGSPASVVIDEDDKSNVVAPVFKLMAAKTPGLRIDLKPGNDTDADGSVLDEVYVTWGAKFSNKIDGFDVPKLGNPNENLTLIRSSNRLMVERRANEVKDDTVYLETSNLAAKAYVLAFNPEALANRVQSAVLIDSYLSTAVPISLTEMSTQTFTVTDGPGSSAAGRFKVILSMRKPLSVDATDVRYVQVYPNPVTGSTVNVTMKKLAKGKYRVQLLNGAGSVVYETALQHDGTNSTKKLDFGAKMPGGVYHLVLTSGSTKITQKISIQ